MHRNLMILAAVCLTASGTTTLSAADWAKSMFPVKSHDFGTVAVAAKTEFVFPIKNRTNQPIHISNVRASCGCTTPILSQQWIQPGEEGSLTARFNTGSFHGKKGATLTVVIDRPVFAEVQLRVDGYIRRDMVFNPGAVEFGKLDAGEGGQKTVSVAYAGRGDWQILGIESPNPLLTAQVQEASRSGQRVDYRINVSLAPNAPVGMLRENLIVKTNDRSMPRVPLAVTGEVTAALNVAPQTFSVNEMKPGESIKQRLVVTGKESFQVTEIVCPGFDVQFKPSEKSLKAHVLTVELVALPNPGAIKSTLLVKTDGGEVMTAESIVTGEIIDR